MNDTRKIEPLQDGYCAWHDEKGVLLESGTGTAIIFKEYTHACTYMFTRGRSRENGWTIKPVWFSTTSPISEEDLEDKAHEAINNVDKDALLDSHTQYITLYQLYMQAWRDITGGSKG